MGLKSSYSRIQCPKPEFSALLAEFSAPFSAPISRFLPPQKNLKAHSKCRKRCQYRSFEGKRIDLEGNWRCIGKSWGKQGSLCVHFKSRGVVVVGCRRSVCRTSSSWNIGVVEHRGRCRRRTSSSWAVVEPWLSIRADKDTRGGKPIALSFFLCPCQTTSTSVSTSTDSTKDRPRLVAPTSPSSKIDF